MNNCEKFSLLDKNDKTFAHLNDYYSALWHGKDLMKIDSIVQKNELEYHLNVCAKTQSAEEKDNWIKLNAEPLRKYINSLKILALYLYLDSKIYYRNEISWELFEKIIDLWNQEKMIVLETIRIKE